MEMPSNDPSPPPVYSPPLAPTQDPTPIYEPANLATVKPEPNRAATLHIKVSASMNGLHAHVTKELSHLREYMATEFAKLHVRAAHIESIITKLQSLVSPPALAALLLSTAPPIIATTTADPASPFPSAN